MGLFVVDTGVKKILHDMDMSVVECEEFHEVTERVDLIVVDLKVGTSC